MANFSASRINRCKEYLDVTPADEVYKKYYELNPDNTYKRDIWENIYKKFHKLDIKI